MTTTIVFPDGHTETVDDGQPQAVIRVWNVRDFMRRFTPHELVAIETLAETDVPVRVYLRMLYASSDMDPDAPEVAAALAHLVTAGILAADRPAKVLL